MPTDIPTLEFDSLPRYQPRRFVPDSARLTDCEELTGLYHILLGRPIHSANELQQWLLDRSELDAAVDQEGSLIYIRMTCQTDDEARAKAYRDFITNVVPAIKPLSDQLDKKYIAERSRFPLDKTRYEIYDKIVRANTELFFEENIPLQT